MPAFWDSVFPAAFGKRFSEPTVAAFDSDAPRCVKDDRDLAYLPEGRAEFAEYLKYLNWAQQFALLNREEMMDRVIAEIRRDWWRGAQSRLSRRQGNLREHHPGSPGARALRSTNFGRPALRRHVGGRKTSRAALRGGRRAGLANRGCRGRSGGRCHGVGLPAVAAHSLIGSRFADYHSSTISRIGIICLRISGRSVSPTYCQEFRTAASKSSVVTGSKP